MTKVRRWAGILEPFRSALAIGCRHDEIARRPRGKARGEPQKSRPKTQDPPIPPIADEAVCIRHWDFSETSQTVSLFTREHGIVRGLAKGAKREKGAFSGGIDVLTRGQVVAILKSGPQLATLTEWRLEDSFRHVRQGLAANRAALYMADLVHHMLTDQDPHQALYDAFVPALGDLADASRIDRALLELQWAVLKETGYQPQLDRDASTGGPLPDGGTLAFSPRAGGVVADTGEADRWRVRRETVELLRAVAAGSWPEDVDDAAAGRANRLLAAYARELIGSEVPTLRWAFPDLHVD
ncbi:MAG: DNA repair protein RecO [Planctomycetota bacterium]|jgi:DNA repair protein RecO (recombination protein O)